MKKKNNKYKISPWISLKLPLTWNLGITKTEQSKTLFSLKIPYDHAIGLFGNPHMLLYRNIKETLLNLSKDN